MKLTLQQAHHILEQEIEWCIKHPDTSLDPSYQRGFVSGLRQAQLLLKKGEEVKEEVLYGRPEN
jgi:hypothetical protein